MGSPIRRPEDPTFLWIFSLLAEASCGILSRPVISNFNRRPVFESYLPIFILAAISSGLALTLLAASNFIGPKRPSKLKQSVYESGMDPIGSARKRYSIKFYLVAMIFIVFDVEVVFLYPWAVSFKDFLASGYGLTSLIIVTTFVVILLVGLLYDFKKGGLEWD